MSKFKDKLRILFTAVGTEALRVEGVVFLQYSTGLFNAPNWSAARALAVTMSVAMLAAALRAFQVWFPKFSWARFIKNKVVAAWADAFSRAGVASFAATILAYLAAPDYALWHSVLLGAVTGALAAGARALQGIFHPDETVVPSKA